MDNDKIKTAVIARVLYGVLEVKEYTKLIRELSNQPVEINATQAKEMLGRYNITLDDFISQGNRVMKELYKEQ